VREAVWDERNEQAGLAEGSDGGVGMSRRAAVSI
jgi:hypothetical protein